MFSSKNGDWRDCLQFVFQRDGLVSLREVRNAYIGHVFEVRDMDRTRLSAS